MANFGQSDYIHPVFTYCLIPVHWWQRSYSSLIACVATFSLKGTEILIFISEIPYSSFSYVCWQSLNFSGSVAKAAQAFASLKTTALNLQ